MNTAVRNTALTSIIVSLGLFAILIPFSLLLGWNILTLFIYWFVIVPVVTIYLPNMMFKFKANLIGKITGLVLFYVFMIFMIYKLFQTDFFQVMMVSFAVNMIVVLGSYFLQLVHKVRGCINLAFLTPPPFLIS